MSRTVTISDELYERLEGEARSRGLDSVERLLEDVGRNGINHDARAGTVRRVDELRARLSAAHGEMSDSTELLAEDRAR
jgi:predicted CopG family antitoxin